VSRLSALLIPSFAIAALLLPARAEAASCGILCQTSNGNSIIAVNPNTSEGLLSWVMDGTQHGFQDWYWIGDGVNGEVSLDSLTLVSTDQASDITLSYSTADLDINVLYSLLGGVPGSGFR